MLTAPIVQKYNAVTYFKYRVVVMVCKYDSLMAASFLQQHFYLLYKKRLYAHIINPLTLYWSETIPAAIAIGMHKRD